jgi:hypothetical protein
MPGDFAQKRAIETRPFEFVEENGGGPVARLRKRHPEKELARGNRGGIRNRS